MLVRSSTGPPPVMVARRRATTIATSSSRLKRPEAPPWPAPMLVRSSDRPAAGHGGAQARDPLGRLPVGHARIGQAGHGEDRGVALRRDVVVGRVGEDGAERRGVGDRVAPFGPFRRRERQRVVEHGVQHVDERHLGDDGGEQLGRAVGDRAHQHAAGAAAMRRRCGRPRCSAARSARGRRRRNRRSVLVFFSRLPSRYQCQPLSAPPRIWAMA